MSNFKIKLPIDVILSDKELKNRTDALNDFYISINRILNYTFETILLLNIKDVKNSIPSIVHTNLKDFLGNPINSPILEIKESSQKFQVYYVEELFKSSLFRIVSFFENYLDDLIHELFWYNKSLLQKEDKKITISEIFKFENFKNFENNLIDNLTMAILMKPYSKLVSIFEKKFYIGIHDKNFPVQFEEINNFIELRNLIAHNNGYANKQYLNRVQGYEELNFPGVLTKINSPLKIDFNWLYEITIKLLYLSKNIDRQATDKWNTSANQ